VAQTKLLASVGLDLFRSGLAIDGAGTKPLHHPESHHPAIAPNLSSIPEGEQVDISNTTSSHIIVIMGAPLKSGNVPGIWLSHRIDTAVPLYRSLTEQQRASCYIIPFGGDGSEQGIIETEVMRNQLVHRGVSPHHIMMDCIDVNTIDNIVTLSRIMRHLHISTVRVITSGYQLPRMQLYFDSLLKISDQNVQVFYHPTTQDHFSHHELTMKEAHEQSLIVQTRRKLEEAMQRLQIEAQAHQNNMNFTPPAAPTSFYG
jgi:vancomycin permeability regulator SanA